MTVKYRTRLTVLLAPKRGEDLGPPLFLFSGKCFSLFLRTEAEDRQSLLKAVDGLEEPGREILVRRYCFGQKPKEIALALDLNVKQVDNHLYRAKRKLREVVAP